MNYFIFVVGVILWFVIGAISFVLDCKLDKNKSFKDNLTLDFIQNYHKIYIYGGVVSLITVICKFAIDKMSEE